MNLPADCYLAYSLPHEAWYARAVGLDRQPEVMVTASSRDGGCAWEFGVREHDLSKTAIRAEVFDDALDAFTQIPEFFAALAATHAGTLEDVVAILVGLGAVDSTERTGPDKAGTGKSVRAKIARAIRSVDGNADAAADAVIRALGGPS